MSAAADPVKVAVQTPAEVLVGRKLRELRSRHGLSLRSLADRSGLNINTLSLIENGKSSPSVSTLQQLALALSVPLSAFFEDEFIEKRVVFTPAHSRPLAEFGSTQMENLAQNLVGNAVQPYMVTLKPGMGSGDRMIVHTGYEFVYLEQRRFSTQLTGWITCSRRVTVWSFRRTCRIVGKTSGRNWLVC